MTGSRLVNFEISMVYHLMERQMDDRGRSECSLTRAQCGIIHFLSDNENRDIFQRDIEETFKIRRSTVSVLLSAMESAGYIERKSVDYDARLNKIVLTDRAVAINNRINSAINEYNRFLVEDIPKDKLDTFYEVLDGIRSKIEKMERSTSEK